MSRRKISETEILEIIEKYNEVSYTIKDLAKEFNRDISTIRRLLKENGVELKRVAPKHRKYSFDESFLDIIDTQDKAYFLGWMYSDGYNTRHKNTCGIHIQHGDIYILEYFKSIFNYDGKIKIELRSKKNNKHKDMCKLEFFGQKMCDRLAELGCVQAKSLILKFPTENQIPEHLIPHFIRGYFDGDGNIQPRFTKNGTMSIRVRIVSNIDFCESLSKYLSEKLNINSTLYIPHEGTSTRMLTINNGSELFMEWIYKDSNLLLKRKYDTFIEYKINKEQNNKIVDTNQRPILPTRANFKNLLQDPPFKSHMLTVVDYAGVKHYNNSTRPIHFWVCKCDCGNFTEVRTTDITGGHIRSCGCLVTKHIMKFNINR